MHYWPPLTLYRDFQHSTPILFYDHSRSSLLLLQPSILLGIVDMRRLDEEPALEELQPLIERNDRQTDVQHSLPFVPVQRDDAEKTLQEGHVEERKVQRHGKADSVDEHHVLPQRQGNQRLGGAEGVHSVEHLDDDKDGKRDGGGGLRGRVGEHRAPDLRELCGAAMEVAKLVE